MYLAYRSKFKIYFMILGIYTTGMTKDHFRLIFASARQLPKGFLGHALQKSSEYSTCTFLLRMEKALNVPSFFGLR
jgi:hypothetical protein